MRATPAPHLPQAGPARCQEAPRGGKGHARSPPPPARAPAHGAQVSKCHHAPARRVVNASRQGNAKRSWITSWANSKWLGCGRPRWREEGAEDGSTTARGPGYRFGEGHSPAQAAKELARPEPGALHSHSPGPEGVRSWAQELRGVSRCVTSPFLGPKLLVDQPVTGTRGPATSLTVPPVETAHRAARMNGPGRKTLCNAHAPGGLKRGGHRVWKRSHQGRRRSHGSTCSARGPEGSHGVPRTGGLSTQSRAPHHTPPAPPQEGRMEVT